MKTQTSELTKVALNWAVAKCEECDNEYRVELLGYGHLGLRPFMRDVSPSSAGGGWWAHFSTDWSQGGPIIEREKVWVKERFPGLWDAFKVVPYEPRWKGILVITGTTYLEAAMRCYVFSRLGEEVDIPKTLLETADE